MRLDGFLTNRKFGFGEGEIKFRCGFQSEREVFNRARDAACEKLQNCDNGFALFALQFALHFFRSNAYLMLLAGTAVLLFSMLGKDLGEAREFIYRPAFGLIVPAAIVFGTMSVLLGKTNNYAYPAVGRLLNGYNLIVVGLAGFFAFVAGFVLLFQKGSSGNAGRVVWSMILVYTTAWAVQGAMFGRQVLDAPSPPGTPPPPPAPGDVRPEPMQKPLA